MIKKDAKSFPEDGYRININEFADEIEYGGKNRLQQLIPICKGIIREIIQITNRDGTVLLTSWARSIFIDEKNHFLQIRFDRDLQPYLLELKERFTSFDLTNILRLNGLASIRLYQILKKDYYKKEIKIELTDLKESLNSKALMYGHFKQSVLIPSQKDIEEKTDISFSFDPIKRGRKIVAIKFKIKLKETAKMDNNQPELLGLNEELRDQDSELKEKLKIERIEAEKFTKRCKSYLDSLPELERENLVKIIESQMGKVFDLKMRIYFKKEKIIESEMVSN